MFARLLAVGTFVAALVVVAACGGATDSELFAAPTSSASPAEPEPTGDAPPSPGGGKRSGAGEGGTSSGSSGASSSGGTSGAPSSSGGTSSGSNGTTADAGAADAGWKSAGIWCGQNNAGNDVYCGANTQACCVDERGSNFSMTCTSTVGCKEDLTIRCDDETDCPSGQVCCGSFDESFGYKSVQCSPTCTSVGGMRAIRFCDPDAPVDECKKIGRACESSQGLPGYYICR